jgi:hypothetical protein
VFPIEEYDRKEVPMIRCIQLLPVYLHSRVAPLVLGLLPIICLAGDWSDDIRLTQGASWAAYVHLSSDSQSNIHLVWGMEEGGADNIWYAKADSIGQIVIAPKQVTYTSEPSWCPELVVDSRDQVHIFWRELGPTGLDVWYTKLDTSGESLIPPKMVVDANGTIFDWLKPAVGVDHNDNLHLVWDQSDDNTEIHYTKLDNGGDVLVEDVYLSWQGYDAREAAIALDALGQRACRVGRCTRITS